MALISIHSPLASRQGSLAERDGRQEAARMQSGREIPQTLPIHTPVTCLLDQTAPPNRHTPITPRSLRLQYKRVRGYLETNLYKATDDKDKRSLLRYQKQNRKLNEGRQLAHSLHKDTQHGAESVALGTRTPGLRPSREGELHSSLTWIRFLRLQMEIWGV